MMPRSNRLKTCRRTREKRQRTRFRSIRIPKRRRRNYEGWLQSRCGAPGDSFGGRPVPSPLVFLPDFLCFHQTECFSFHFLYHVVLGDLFGVCSRHSRSTAAAAAVAATVALIPCQAATYFPILFRFVVSFRLHFFPTSSYLALVCPLFDRGTT